MDVRIAGGHGQIARFLTRQLTDRGDTVHGFIRSEDQTEDLQADGAQPVLLDLETATLSEVTAAVEGADAVVFAAGAGPGSGAERKWSVDHGAAVKLLRAAEEAKVGRYVMISSMGADNPPQEEPDEDVFAVYLRAKAAADRELMASDLDWTIIRPGGLTDDDPTGAVQIGASVGRAEIPREDVATVLRACLDDDRSAGTVLEVVSGDTNIQDALAAHVG